MGEEQPVRDKVIVFSEAGLEGGKGLLIVLQRVDILAGATVREAECGYGHDGV